MCRDVGSGTTHTTEFDIYSRPITATSLIDGKNYVRSTLYNANGQVSFVGYPAMEFTQPYPDSQNGKSLRDTYQNGYLAAANRGDVDENFMTVVARYADGSITRSANVLTKTDRDYDFLGRLTASRLADSGSATPKQTSATIYDALGNILTRTQSGLQTWNETFTYGKLNRVSTVTSAASGIAGKTFSYTDDGNQTGKTFAYDYNGNFIGFTDSSRAIT